MIIGERPAGNFNINWDGTDVSGNKVSTGIYLYTLTTATERVTKKMIFSFGVTIGGMSSIKPVGHQIK